MENEIENVNVAVDDTNTDYIEQIEALKKNTVSKEAYDKILNERKTLISKLANGESVESDKVAKVTPITDLLDTLNNANTSNLDYCKAALELRNQYMQQTGEDLFLPQGSTYTKTETDMATAQKVAENLQYCIDNCEGNDEAFTNLLSTRINNDSPMLRRK